MLLLILAAFVQLTGAAPQSTAVRTFDEDTVGAPPAGFLASAGREALADGWVVRREGKGRVLLHEGRPSPADGFAVTIFSGGQYQDVELSVRLKAIGGSRS